MATFYVGGEFPSFKPIRVTGEKVTSLVDNAITRAAAKDKPFLTALKTKAAAEPTREFYFTVVQANLLGIL